MNDFLFDTPYWVYAVLLIAAVALWLQGNMRQSDGLKRAGYATIGIGIVLALLSHFVSTDKQKCIQRTRELVEVVQDRKTDLLQEYLSQSVTLGVWGKADILAGYAAEQDRHMVKGVTITSISAEQNQAAVTVTLSIVAQIESNSPYGTVPTTWQLEWQKSADGWHVTRIHLLDREGMNMESQLFGRHLVAPPGGE